MHQPQTFAWGGQRYRYGAWHAEDGTAFLSPEHAAGPPSPQVLRRLLDQLADLGFLAVVTSALNESVTPTFLSVGFERIDELAVLRHDLADIAASPGMQHRRGTTRDRAAVLDVDARAFQPAWRLDGAGLDDAIHATPAAAGASSTASTSRRRSPTRCRAGAGAPGSCSDSQCTPTTSVRESAGGWSPIASDGAAAGRAGACW